MPHYILWRSAPSRTRPGYTDKLPVSPHTGKVCNPHDPQHHVAEQQAVQAAALYPGCQVGYVFTAQAGRWFLDLDHCLQADGTWSPLAVQVCQACAGAYVEVSQSGTGLHIIGSGTPPTPSHGTRNPTYQLELYTSGRFVALTGCHASGSMSYPAQAQLDWLLSFPGWSGGPATPTAPVDWTDTPVPEWSGPTDDNDLINRMMLSRPSASAALAGKATLLQLWLGDAEALSNAFPDPRGYDASAADAALCAHLAWWTGKDCGRMDRLFRQSGLCRDKWLDREDYRQNTVLKAVARCTSVMSSRPTPAQITPEQPTQAELTGSTGLCSISQQPEVFKGCVYIRDLHRVWVPDGSLLNPERFRVEYGGRTFFMDSQGVKTTNNAWECFTESKAIRFPQATGMCFRPEQPAGAILEEEGLRVVNTYRPIETRIVTDGDPSRFQELLRKMLPDDRDREILTSYMAAMVQNPGKKFQWWPVIQGCEGNGKSAIIRAMEHAVGKRYTHLPNVDDMARNGAKFNSWVVRKLFIGIEEIYVNDRRDFLEAFKATVTNDRIQIEGKGTDQIMGDNRANGIMCTNHQDGVPTTVDQRRYAILYTAQQSAADKTRDGMDGEYFPDLYDWLKGEGDYSHLGTNYGYGVVNHWLRTYKVAAEFNPARACQVAPKTSSTAEAIKLSMGGIEQEIIEAIESGLPGFCGGWISSLALDRLLTERRLASKLPRAKRRDMLRSLGYDWHPGLKNSGRVWNPIQDCGVMGKPVIYCKVGHIVGQIVSPADIVRHYLEAQQTTTAASVALAANMGG